MTAQFKDHFSEHAQDYFRSRPDYPIQLFEYLSGLAPSRHRAWDCGTGNGQAGLALTRYFDEVVATDPSTEQIKRAVSHSRIRYCAALAENSCLADRCVDIVVAAQALHWFDVRRFFREVNRVTRTSGIVAVWCYQLAYVDPQIDRHFHRFYSEILGPYWPAERRYVDDGYRSVDFPFDELKPPEFKIKKQWTLRQFLSYMASWSATRRYVRACGADPIPSFGEELARLWGPQEKERTVSWPVKLRVGRVAAG